MNDTSWSLLSAKFTQVSKFLTFKIRMCTFISLCPTLSIWSWEQKATIHRISDHMTPCRVFQLQNLRRHLSLKLKFQNKNIVSWWKYLRFFFISNTWYKMNLHQKYYNNYAVTCQRGRKFDIQKHLKSWKSIFST